MHHRPLPTSKTRRTIPITRTGRTTPTTSTHTKTPSPNHLPLRLPQPPLNLKITPPFHNDPTRIKLALLPMSTLPSPLSFATDFARVTPAEVVEVPVCVGRED